MKLAIVTVYHVQPEDSWLLDLHLDRIEANTTPGFVLHAAPLRLEPSVLARLQARDWIRIHDLPPPPTPLRPAMEHSYYLDRLLGLAAEDDTTHLACLDHDAFPIRPGWAENLASRLGVRTPLAAVQRAENGDTELPHPAGALFDADWYREHRPVAGSPQSALEWPEALALSKRWGQALDVGIGWAVALHASGCSWVRLLRTNRRNFHYLIAGIYGGLIFHMGGMGRGGAPPFRGDFRTLFSAPLRRPARCLRAPRDDAGGLEPLLRVLETIDEKIGLMYRRSRPSRSSLARARQLLRQDPDALFDWLEGGDAGRLA